MPRTSRPVFAVTTTSLVCLIVSTTATTTVARAQTNFDMSLHASSHVTAEDIGLPTYPGATLAKGHGSNDAAFDIGFNFGDTHFRMRGLSYDSPDSPDRILVFYRKALARYGDVLECDHGRPVGRLTVTSSGLRCSDRKTGDHLSIDGHFDESRDHDLRAGSPDDFRIVGVNGSDTESARFVMMDIKTPHDTGRD